MVDTKQLKRLDQLLKEAVEKRVAEQQKSKSIPSKSDERGDLS